MHSAFAAYVKNMYKTQKWNNNNENQQSNLSTVHDSSFLFNFSAKYQISQLKITEERKQCFVSVRGKTRKHGHMSISMAL